MANRVKFEFLDNLRKTEEELLSIVLAQFPDLTPIDCYITRNYGIVAFLHANNINNIFADDQVKKLKESHLLPKPNQEYYSQRTIYVNNVRPFLTQYTADELINSINAINKNITAESLFTIYTISNTIH